MMNPLNVWSADLSIITLTLREKIMAITLAHILNEPISYASANHADLKQVFDKFKKILKKFANTGILAVEDEPADKSKITLSFIDRDYEIRFSSSYVDNVFLGKISAWSKSDNTEIGSVTFNSRKARITDPLTKAEGSLHEPHFCRILIYAWLLKDIGWNMGQINNFKPQADAPETSDDSADLDIS
jgi:hypothetical protein